MVRNIAWRLNAGTGNTVTGTYGTLTMNSDGSYTYTLIDDDPDVLALMTATDPVVDHFSYTISDQCQRRPGVADHSGREGRHSAIIKVNQVASTEKTGGLAAQFETILRDLRKKHLSGEPHARKMTGCRHSSGSERPTCAHREDMTSNTVNVQAANP